MNFAKLILQKRKKLKLSEHCEYDGLDGIPPTSANVERLFSVSGKLYDKDRNRLEPETLERLLFFRFNRKHLRLLDIQQALTQPSKITKDAKELSDMMVKEEAMLPRAFDPENPPKTLGEAVATAKLPAVGQDDDGFFDT